jgi:hypothetical protein
MRKISLLTALFAVILLPAQVTEKTLDQKIATSLHENGSMNVVFVVVAVILAGLFIGLWRLDRKVTKLEKEMNEPGS